MNNITMFMKGTNWIPAHVLPEMVTEHYTRELLTAAADTHQNCIRVWGGGIYETDVFYEVLWYFGIHTCFLMLRKNSVGDVEFPFLRLLCKRCKIKCFFFMSLLS